MDVINCVLLSGRFTRAHILGTTTIPDLHIPGDAIALCSLFHVSQHSEIYKIAQTLDIWYMYM